MINFGALGIEINPRGATEQRVPCPQCSKKSRDDSLGANLASGCFHCFRCAWSGRVGGSTAHAPVQHLNDPTIALRKRERLRKTWRETFSLSSPKARAVRAYLASRALGEVLRDPPTTLRAHPALSYWDGPNDLGKFPAMIALFHAADGKPISLHATFLQCNGHAKARVPNPKKLLGVAQRNATRGGAIRLHTPGYGVLGLGEGIETALSLCLLRQIPVWSAYCAGNLERIVLPNDLREVHIAVDLDESGKGEHAARALASRIAKTSPPTKVYLVRPEREAPGDLNDELMHARVGAS